MFAPSRGNNNNVNNKLMMELIYLLPHPPPPLEFGIDNDYHGQDGNHVDANALKHFLA